LIRHVGPVVLIALGSAVVAGTLTGCTPDAPPAQPQQSVSSIEVPEGSSQFQRDVVARYEAGETVEFEAYAEAIRGTKECLVAAGFRIANEQNVTDSGKPMMTYDAKVPKELAESKGESFFDAAFQECWQNNSAVVESLYAGAAGSVEETESQLAALKAQYAPLIEECLLALGIEKPADASAEWWGEAAIEANQSLPGSPDCLDETGYLDATAALQGVND